MLPIYYMFQKELLQHKLITRLPLFALTFLLLMITLFIYGLNSNIEFSMDGIGQDDMLNIQHSYLSVIGFGATLLSYLLSIFYISKSICDDRKEGSLVFWRSMPVSDLSTHLVKLGFAVLFIPFICSLLILSADLFIWLISLFSPEHINFLIGTNSLFAVLENYISFLLHMLLVGVALLPFACLIFALSQLYDSPLLIAIIGIYALKMLSAGLLPDTDIEQFFYQFINLPTSLVFTTEPIKLISELAVFNTLIMYTFGMLFFVLSLYIQKHGELNLGNLTKQK